MKKGFTLIELLAVIVILAVITLIVTPVVSGIIASVKNSAVERSAEGYASAVNMTLASSFFDSDYLENGRYYINSNGNLTKFGKEYKIEVNGAKPISGEVTIRDEKVIDGVITFNDKVVKYSNGNGKAIKADKNKIYGLEYNIDTKTYKRLNSAAGLNACVGTDIDSCNNDFDSEEIYRDISEETDSYGNVFIKIPKFYIKKDFSDNYLRWYISKIKQDNSYYLPACFYDFTNNKELDYVYVGKYDANISVDNKLESKTNKIPLVNKSINDFRTLALANNKDDIVGYQQMDIHVLDVIKTLFYVEEGTLDSKSIMMGYNNGINAWQDKYKPIINANNSNVIKLDLTQINDFRVGQKIDISSTPSSRDIAVSRKIKSINTTTGELVFDGSPVDITTSQIISNSGNDSGMTDTVLTSSGSCVDNTSGKYSMNYRGIENIYGNVWQYIDGVIIDNKSDGSGTIYVNKNSLTYEYGNISGDYHEVTSYKKYNNEGFTNKMGYDSTYPFIQMPIENVSYDQYDNSVYKEYFYKNNDVEMKILQAGGRWDLGILNGISLLSSSYNSYGACFIDGGRLVKKAL